MFLTAPKKTEAQFSVTKPLHAEQVQAYANDLAFVVKHTTPEELSILARIVGDPFLKPVALAEAKKRIKL